MPKSGWECTGMTDLGDPSAICEMCEVQEIRYVHSMEHKEWPTTLECGCICAGNMEANAARARVRDGILRARAARKKRATPEWW